ncbi:helix-turn-helix domain-containing protein [Pedobacter sp. SYSU D00535]|uniref:winged helix-turn-helix transcriptional regulator n=1 Tax=Pedobacter sp. SYSU D00535 TaxID=2810308 RepID=UPI001A97ABBB|nr:helix-turn-helix domain-containing protein [Pedobacter sp. SYSU D00535]
MEVTNGSKGSGASSEKVGKRFPDSMPTKTMCPISDVIDRISDKWSVHAIIVLGKSDKLRFGEMMKKIHGVSQRMLTVTLRHLEQDGLVTRTVYPEIPPRVEYQLTELGRSLLVQLMHLSDWATENMTHIFEARRQALEREAEIKL